MGYFSISPKTQPTRKLLQPEAGKKKALFLASWSVFSAFGIGSVFPALTTEQACQVWGSTPRTPVTSHLSWGRL